jgi:hypothetical protein
MEPYALVTIYANQKFAWLLRAKQEAVGGALVYEELRHLSAK